MPAVGAALAGLARRRCSSPLIGGMFALIYGVTCVIGAMRSGWRELPAALLPHATAAAAVPVRGDLGLRDGRGGRQRPAHRLRRLRAPVSRRHAAAGDRAGAAAGPGRLWPRRFPAPLIPAAVGLVAGAALFYLASLPHRDPIWVGWRAGQIMLVACRRWSRARSPAGWSAHARSPSPLRRSSSPSACRPRSSTPSTPGRRQLSDGRRLPLDADADAEQQEASTGFARTRRATPSSRWTRRCAARIRGP